MQKSSDGSPMDTVMPPSEQPFLIWDACQIAKDQAEFLMEQAKEEGKELTENEAFDQACEDPDLLDFEWDDLTSELTELMNRINPDGWWYCTVENFGWMKNSGHKDIVVKDGRELLQEVLPNCDCSFWIYDRGDHIAINNTHHDSPTFTEWYYIYPKFQCGGCGKYFIKKELGMPNWGLNQNDFACAPCRSDQT